MRAKCAGAIDIRNSHRVIGVDLHDAEVNAGKFRLNAIVPGQTDTPLYRGMDAARSIGKRSCVFGTSDK